MYTWRDREVVMDLLAAAHRQPRQLRHQHHRRRAARHHRRNRSEQILKGVDILEERTKYYIEVATEETTLIQRLSGVGMLSHDDAVRLGAVGPTGARLGRATATSARTIPMPPTASSIQGRSPTTTATCTAARSSACGELMESYKIIRQVLEEHARRPDRREGAAQDPRRRGRSAATKRRAARTCTTSKPTAPKSRSA